MRMQAWVSAFVIGACAWRLLAELRGWRLPPALLRGLIAAGVTAGVVIGYSTITGLDGGTALLALMSALKLLETKTARDHAVLIFIGWFLCLAAFLYSQDVATSAWVLPTVWLLAAALLRVSRRGTAASRPRPFRTTGGMLLKAAPVALVLFLFFPRIEGSFWGAPSSRARTDRTRRRDVARDISDLTQNDVVAFRVRFQDGPPPLPPLRYWRGPVFSQFDGYTWSRGDAQSFFRAGHRACGFAGRLHHHARAHRPADAVCARHGRKLDAGTCRPGLGLRAAHAPPRQRGAAIRRALVPEVPRGRGHRARAQECEPEASAQPQPARGGVRAEPARARRKRHGLCAGRARSLPRAGLLLHADAAGPRARLGRRFPLQHAPGLLRALCLGIHEPDARRRDPGARRRRIPGRGLEPARRLPDRAQFARARLVGGLVAGRRLAPRGPDRGGRTRARRARARGLVRGFGAAAGRARAGFTAGSGRRACSGTA